MKAGRPGTELYASNPASASAAKFRGGAIVLSRLPRGRHDQPQNDGNQRRGYEQCAEIESPPEWQPRHCGQEFSAAYCKPRRYLDGEHPGAIVDSHGTADADK